MHFTLPVIVSIGLFFLALLIGIIGFFLRSTLSDIKDSLRGIQEELKNQNKTVSRLETENIQIKERINSIEKSIEKIADEFKTFKDNQEKAVKDFYKEYQSPLDFFQKFHVEVQELIIKMRSIMP